MCGHKQPNGSEARYSGGVLLMFNSVPDERHLVRHLCPLRPDRVAERAGL